MAGPRLIAGLALAVALALFVLPAPEGVDARMLRGAALVVFAIGLYATGVVPEYLTALAFFLIAMLFAVAPAGVVFAGFQSTALWLVFGGLVIGVAVKKTGLGERLAHRIAGWFGQSYAGLIAGTVMVGVALSFVMPSTMGRVVLLVPIVAVLADRLGFARGSRGRSGLVLATALGTWMPSTGILPSNVPNMVLAGTAETLYGISLTYGSYMLLHFPVLGALKAVAIFLVLLILFRDTPRPVESEAPPGPMSAAERLLAVVLLACLTLWASDFLHGISPAWISLGAAVFLLLPRFGLITMGEFNEKTNFASVIYVAGVLSLGVVVAETGLGTELGHLVLAVLPLAPGAEAQSYFSLVGLSTVVGMAATMPGVPAVLSPLAQDMAAASNLPLLTVLMTQVIGYSTIILPYQVPPVIVAVQIGGIGGGAAARATLALAVLTFLLLVPLNYVWWRIMGML